MKVIFKLLAEFILSYAVVFGVLLVYLLDLGEIGALDRLFAVLVFLFPAQ